MELTLHAFLIVCPLLFLAGFVDSIGGGGGLISVPAFLMAGLPPHAAVATNKLAACGSLAISTTHFFRNKCISIRLAIPSVIAAILGSSIGAHLSLMLSEKTMTVLLLILLPVSAFFVLNKKLFKDNGKETVTLDRRTYITATLAAFFVGGYDGFYGPGCGTFLIIAFTVFAGLSMRNANGQSKVINLTTNITSLTVFLLNGRVLIPIGLAGCICNMLGGYLGAVLALKNGTKIVKPVILLVLTLLFLKIITGM